MRDWSAACGAGGVRQGGVRAGHAREVRTCEIGQEEGSAGKVRCGEVRTVEVTGWTMPLPAPAFAHTLAEMEPWLRDCVLSHAVDAAVASRIPVISSRLSGPGLAVHVTTAMRAALDEDRWLCERNEPQWLAPPYQWALVLDSLRARHRRDPGAGPDPRTAEWEATYARAIPGQTCASQLEVVQRWHGAAQRDQQQVRAVAYGARPASALEHAVGARPTDPDWEQRLADALTAFRDCRWPLDHLRPAATGP
jgi:uncharacterized protein